MRKLFSLILNEIQKSDSIVIFSHANCDGDCYGAQIGLKDIILSTYPDKKVFAIGSGFFNLFKLLGEPDKADDEIIKNSLLVLVDFNELSRSEDERIYLGNRYICLDHHNKGPNFNNYQNFFVNQKRSSASPIVYEFYKEMGLKISSLGINALYAGIVSDTNRFQYLEDDGFSLMCGHELVEKGANFKAIYNAFGKTNKTFIALKQYIYTNMKHTDAGVVYCVVRREYLDSINFNDYAGSMVNVLSNIEGYPIWALFVEHKDKKMSIELRSNKVEVLSSAIKYGGGGHMFASGISKSIYDENIINSVLSDLDRLLLEDKKNV